MRIEPWSAAFVAEVHGVDLRAQLAPHTVAAVVDAMNRYAVLVFRGQPIDDAQQMQFARCFGALQDERGGSILRPEELRLPRVFADISNLDTDGSMLAAEDRRDTLSARQPLAPTLAATGRKSLYLSAHAAAIDGLPLPLARVFLRDLTDHATQREFVHRHRWQLNDLVMWDNRVTMHRGRRYPEFEQLRDLRRLSIAGQRPAIEPDASPA